MTMNLMSSRSRMTGLLTWAAVIASFISLRFARSVLEGMLVRSGTTDAAALSRPTIIALGLTRPAFLLSILLLCLAVVAIVEATVKTETSRLLVQIAVLSIVVGLFVVVLSGFFISFYIPDVRIP